MVVSTEENAFLILKREINLFINHSVSVPPKHFQIQYLLEKEKVLT